jgi:RimJ/RimL family protein N-acetyltransferase
VQPTLTTPRLALRPVEPSDVDALWSLWTDADVRRFLWDDRAITRDEAAATVNDCVSLRDQGLGLWMIETGAGANPSPDRQPAAMGCAGLLPVSTAAEYEPRLAGLVEPLVALVPNVWGRGYAHESLSALVTYAATTLGLSRLAGVTDVPNTASDRMLRRAGFVVLGETPGPRHALRTYLWEASAASR